MTPNFIALMTELVNIAGTLGFVCGSTAYPPSCPGASASVAPPGPILTIRVSDISDDRTTVTWTPSTTGGIPSCYNVSISDGSSTRYTIPAIGPLKQIFTGLFGDTLYTVSMVALNCAGSSNVTTQTIRTLAPPPEASSFRTLLAYYPSTGLCQLQITWSAVSRVTVYGVRVIGGGSTVGTGHISCTSSPCSYAQPIFFAPLATSYTIFVGSINGDGVTGYERNVTVNFDGLIITSSSSYVPTTSSIRTDTTAAVEITVAVVFFISFIMGSLLTLTVLHFGYIKRSSTCIQRVSSQPTSVPKETMNCNKDQTENFELELNEAYGT